MNRQPLQVRGCPGLGARPGGRALLALAAASFCATVLAQQAPAVPAAEANAGSPSPVSSPASSPVSSSVSSPAPGTGTPSGGLAVPLRQEHLLGAGRGRGSGTGAVFVRADSITGEVDDHTLLEGSVEVRRDGIVLRGERALYGYADDELKVRGHVHLVDRGATFDGPALDFKIEAHIGQMPNASYSYPARQGRGDSRMIEFLSEDNIRLHEATYTTCRPDDMSWWFRAETLDIDRAEQEAIAHSATLYFEGVPIFASPYFEMPLSDERRSGMLAPGYAGNSRLGQEFIFPVYWNIAPNRDYMFVPDIIPRRGISLGNEARFLEPEAKGQLDYVVMPNDRTTGTTREHIDLSLQAQNFSGVSFAGEFDRVSDDNYLIDFSHSIDNASPEVLPQEAHLRYVQPYWSATLNLDKSQTLISLLAPTDPGPYERVPDMTFNAHDADWHGFDIGAAFDAARFQHPAVNPLFTPPTTNYGGTWYTQDGSRLVVNPSISYPVTAPGWFVDPKMQWSYTAYALDPTFHPGATSAIRSMPIGSIDSGLIFERPTTWLGADSRQTLEPRLYYAYAPFRDQSQLPNFDSADADFNFAQLFTENTFTGYDRISQANQVTTAAVSRMIDDGTGEERLRLALGQRFYFGTQQVTLPGELPRTNKSSDTLFLGSAALGKKWNVDVGLDYSTLTSQIALATLGLRWQPRAASVINFSYRYETAALEGQLIDDFRASGQWPLSARWYGVGSAEYSVGQGWVETVAGFEYKADCWVARVAGSRYAVTLPNSILYSNSYTTTWFLQIEFNGLTSIGPSPIDTLQRNISGYQRVNRPTDLGGPFSNYE